MFESFKIKKELDYIDIVPNYFSDIKEKQVFIS